MYPLLHLRSSRGFYCLARPRVLRGRQPFSYLGHFPVISPPDRKVLQDRNTFGNQSWVVDFDLSTRLYLQLAWGCRKLPISVDYELPVVNFYQEFATTFITVSKSLDILRMKQHPAIPGLPSWVPDWTTKSKQSPPSPKGLYHAAGSSNAMAFFESSGHMLCPPLWPSINSYYWRFPPPRPT